jgi:protein-L-isoaspartate(D-aspartate) O-methyltransferase
MGDIDGNKYTTERLRMVNYDLKGRGIADQRVLDVMSELPREIFVEKQYKSRAYSDGPLPIQCNQTISQPYIVALMTESLNITSECEVLEVGTGCGYQTAVSAKLAKRVYTIERFEELSSDAKRVLGQLNIANIEFYTGDGSCGWFEERTFERIMVTAALPKVPESLINQLTDDGIMVAPVGGAGTQRLMRYHKHESKMIETFICDVRFVKVVGRYGFEE